MLLLHSQERGAALVEEVGRAAQLGVAQGIPANVIPVAVWHTASLGIDVWLSAIAMGASQVAVLATSEEAPQYLDALGEQMAVGEALLNGLGYEGTHFSLIRAAGLADLDQELRLLVARRQQTPARPGRFAVAPGKRGTLELALDHLVEQAPQQPVAIELPRGRLAVRHHRRRPRQVHLVPELRQRLPGQRVAGQPAAAAAALHREELRAVRAVRQHLPGKGHRAEAAPAAHARAQGGAAC